MNKLTKLAIILSVFIVLVFAGFFFFKKPTTTPKDVVNQIDTHLSTNDKKTFEDRLTQYKNQIANAQNDQDRYSGYMQLGFTYESLGDLASAKDSFTHALVFHKDLPGPYSALYEIDVNMHDYNGAEDNIKSAIAVDQKNPDLWRKYIALEQDPLKVDNADVDKIYADALSQTGGSIDIITSYAVFKENTGNPDAALYYWKQAAKLYPKNTTYAQQVSRLQKLLNIK